MSETRTIHSLWSVSENVFLFDDKKTKWVYFMITLSWLIGCGINISQNVYTCKVSFCCKQNHAKICCKYNILWWVFQMTQAKFLKKSSSNEIVFFIFCRSLMKYV